MVFSTIDACEFTSTAVNSIHALVSFVLVLVGCKKTTPRAPLCMLSPFMRLTTVQTTLISCHTSVHMMAPLEAFVAYCQRGDPLEQLNIAEGVSNLDVILHRVPSLVSSVLIEYQDTE